MQSIPLRIGHIRDTSEVAAHLNKLWSRRVTSKSVEYRSAAESYDVTPAFMSRVHTHKIFFVDIALVSDLQ